MDDAMVVRFVQSPCHILHDFQRAQEARTATTQSRMEIHSDHQFHDQEWHSVGFAVIVNGRDIRMIQCRSARASRRNLLRYALSRSALAANFTATRRAR